MSFKIDEMQAGTGIDPIDIGTFPSVITGLCTYGIQPQTDYKTGAPKPSEKRLALTFEFPTEAVEKENEDGSTYMMARRLTKEYKVSSHKKANIMLLIRSLAPNIQDLTELLGKGCSTEVGRTSSDKAKVAGVSPLMKGVEVAEPMDGVVHFDFYEPVEADFKSLTKWQQDVIIGAEDYDGFADTWLPEGEDY